MPHLPRTLLRTWLHLSGAALLAATTGAALANNPAPAPATAASTPTLALTPAVRPGAPITLNFVQAEIDAVARAMGVLVGRHVVVDPRISGTLNLQTERPVTPAQALQLFSSALRLRGFAIVESQGLLKVLPEADARLQSGAVLDEAQMPRGQQIVTQIFSLTHENANHLVPILRPLVSAHNPINVNAGQNSLIITDYADNLRRIAQIIAAFDVANATGVEVIGLQHALAGELIPVLQRLLDGDAAAPAAAGQPATAAAGFRTVLLPEPRSNSIIVRAANPARVALVRSLVAQLDRAPSGGAQGNIHVVHLRNANAVELATTLRAALAADSGLGGDTSPATGAATAPAAGAPAGALGALRRTAAGAAVGASGGAAGAGAAPAPSSTGGQIQADAATNSLIISAPEPVFRQLRALIERLDTRRAQVFVESVIAEVSADQASEFGIQWQQLIGRSGAGTIGFLGTNFGERGANLLNLATGAQQMPSTGLNLGLAQRINGSYVLSALVRLLEQSGQANILSTPNLLTLDNEEARIVIGQNVPFITGSFTNVGGQGGAVNPFQTIERRDVGLTLRVRPQISENGTVRLSIFQEVSSVVPASIGSPTGPITNTRSIESNVLVDDGAVIVLGGLLQDEYGAAQDQVPGLSQLPLLGSLFRSERRNRNKTNLMVFLRPVILRDQRASDALSQDRYDLIRAAQQQQQPTPSAVHSINQAPALPALDLSQPQLPLRLLPQPTPTAPAPQSTP
ncbi:type II secretory pathway, component PulD [Serpentinimonas raichei]|uniref:Type II secretory pathway, component PulD n=1 Tax=Serpentinimonas raichei TaxID=1458425 RepID=A0A060NFK6_9BURK|nr:type II secretion system secretin GspD [Serpentinimonas raichei]BAO80241.1 type II secretory pathway, component PulD [Serpentinimonas raichei]